MKVIYDLIEAENLKSNLNEVFKLKAHLKKLSKCGLLLSYFLGLSLLTCAQEITVGETKKVKRKSAVAYSQYITHAQLSFSAGNIKTVKMSTGTGKLEVRPAETDKIEMEAVIENRSLSKKKARKFIEKYLRLSMEDVNGQLEVKSYFEGLPRKWNSKRYGLGHMLETPGSKIHVVLKVPNSIDLSLCDHSGAVYLHDLQNNIYLKDGSGKVLIKNTYGNLEVSDGSGRLEIKNHEGDLKIRDGSGRVTLSSIGMVKRNYQVHITDASGRIYAEGIGADVHLKDGSGRIELKNVSGEVRAIDRSGGLALYGIGKTVDIKDTSGGITLKDICNIHEGTDHISIKDGSGGIYLKNAGTSANINDKSGGISISDVKGDLLISDRSGRISAKNVLGTVSIKDRSGRISAETYLVKN